MYKDGIVGVAAVLAGLRSTLTTGMESYRKQQELMNNSNMMLSVSPSKIYPDTTKIMKSHSQNFAGFEGRAAEKYSEIFESESPSCPPTLALGGEREEAERGR